MSYRQLDPLKLISTAELLNRRVSERFPDYGITQVSAEVLKLTRDSQSKVESISRPMLLIRVIVGMLIVGLISLPILSYYLIEGLSPKFQNIGDFFQAVEAGINDVLLIGAAIYFLLTLETRIKRKRALAALNELRAAAHIIDMHQLTKDPERVLGSVEDDTASSPERITDVFALSRYLDYCSEMLSILSKIAALYVQHFNDPVTLQSVDDIESLTNGLSRKIWQKIMILGITPDSAA